MTITAIIPLRLGDIFDRLFKLIARTWVRNLILASIILALPTIAMIAGMNTFFSGIAGIAAEGGMEDTAGPEVLVGILGGMAWMLLALFAFIVGLVAATLAVTIVSCAEISGQQITWQEAAQRTFGTRLVRLFGQYVLQGLALGSLLLVPYGLLIAAIAMESLGLGLIAGLLLLVSLGFVVYLAIAWTFTVPVIGWEDTGVIEAFSRSRRLVTGGWWRVFGILILLGIILNFAISLVITPVYLVAMWDLLSMYFQMVSAGSSEPDPALALEAVGSFGSGIGLVSGLSSLLQVLVTPLYTSVLYFDLRARKGEFDQPSPAAAA